MGRETDVRVVICHSLVFFSFLSGTYPRTTFGSMISFGGAGSPFQTCDLSVAAPPKDASIDPKALKEINSAVTRMTPMWAQEAIGGPESLRFLIELQSREPKNPLQWVPVGISDGNFRLKDLPLEKLNHELRLKRTQIEYSEPMVKDRNGKPDFGEHTHAVATLISETRGFGTGYFSYLSWFSDGINAARKQTRTSEIAAAEVLPQFVNRSIEANNPTLKDDSTEMKDVSQKSIVVVAAGNQFPWPTDKGAYRAIVVGAVANHGLMASFSRHGTAVDISAPGVDVLAFTKPNHLGLVSGTSFASPIVTGALSTVASLLPGISFDEIKHMLRATAIKTAAYTRSSTGDGAGVVNQYALVRVADRLRKHWPQNRKQIYEKWPYDFRSEVVNRKKWISSLSARLPADVCADRRTLLSGLRQNFFLDPSDKETRSQLARLYSSNGYYLQEFYYEDPAKTLAISTNLNGLLDQREFQVEVARGNLQRLKTLKHVKIASPGVRGDLLLIASERGLTDVLRFLVEEWGNLKVTKKLREDMHTLALRHGHQNAAIYIATLTLSSERD